MHLETVAVRRIVPPYVEKQLLPADRLGRVAQQYVQDAPADGRELYQSALPLYPVLPDIHEQISATQYSGLAAAPLGQGLQPRHQFAHFKGLDQIIVGSCRETGELVVNMSACRKHQNRGVVALLPQPGAERKPVEKRQIEVEHNGVVGRAACRSACQLQAVRAGPGIVAVHVFQCEIFHNGCGQVYIIFHKQDVQHAAPLPYPEAQGNEDFCSLPPKKNSARNEPYQDMDAFRTG